MSRLVDQALIDAYAEVTGDHNPVHVDPAFAAGTPYRMTIAHGLLTAALVVDEATGAQGLAPPLELEIVFVRPVPSGTTVDIEVTHDDTRVEAVGRAGGQPAVVVRVGKF
jgi:acyl dehydratase